MPILIRPSAGAMYEYHRVYVATKPHDDGGSVGLRVPSVLFWVAVNGTVVIGVAFSI